MNTSPEPFTNVAASSAGDVTVTGMATLVALAPVAAAVVAGILLVLGLIVLGFLLHRIRRGWLAFQRWRRREAPAT